MQNNKSECFDLSKHNLYLFVSPFPVSFNFLLVNFLCQFENNRIFTQIEYTLFRTYEYRSSSRFLSLLSLCVYMCIYIVQILLSSTHFSFRFRETKIKTVIYMRRTFSSLFSLLSASVFTYCLIEYRIAFISHGFVPYFCIRLKTKIKMLRLVCDCTVIFLVVQLTNCFYQQFFRFSGWYAVRFAILNPEQCCQRESTDSFFFALHTFGFY